MSEGVVYVAYGKNAREQCAASIRALRKVNPGLPVRVHGEGSYFDASTIVVPQEDPGGRWTKLYLDLLSPYEYTVYLDADTRPRLGLGHLLRPLYEGWEMVITASVNQGDACLDHLDDDERIAVLSADENPLQWQAGVFSFRKTARVHDLFMAWRRHWQTFRKHDQGALILALRECPVRMWVMGHDWNGGAYMEHLFGRAR